MEDDLVNQPEGQTGNYAATSAPQVDWQHDIYEEPIYPVSYNIASFVGIAYLNMTQSVT